ncbi:Hypothetical predicted protein [Scomber scombrus]|uniref:Uncharacterized protein n=1 Tax=Scomber scombrus TaxID=13677 RepID=A0AAV1NJT3_SCOSC
MGGEKKSYPEEEEDKLSQNLREPAEARCTKHRLSLSRQHAGHLRVSRGDPPGCECK